ncbi:MAG: hypothetical protein J7L62_01740, partial [Candidatus Aminicenantes bacterium]|nr:hypothetical protein [Candidatus Aminicenantes bacterium]
MKKSKEIKRKRAEASSKYEKVHYLLDKEEFIEPLDEEIESIRAKLNIAVGEEEKRKNILKKLTGIQQQHAINSMIVQMFNILVPYLLELSKKLSKISELHRKFYMSLVPLIDSKDEEWFSMAIEEIKTREEKFQEYVDSLSNLVNVARTVSLEGGEGKEKLKFSFFYWLEGSLRKGGIKEN